MKPKAAIVREKTEMDRAEEICKTAEEAGMYLYGFADALEALAGEKAANAIHRLRVHALELNSARLYIMYGYQDGEKARKS